MPAALPWKEIFKALPLVVTGAEKAWSRLSSKPKEPPIDPHADLRTQLATLSQRLQEAEAVQAEQAKMVALLAEQLEAVARRARRSYWIGFIGFAIACAALALSLHR